MRFDVDENYFFLFPWNSVMFFVFILKFQFLFSATSKTKQFKIIIIRWKHHTNLNVSNRVADIFLLLYDYYLLLFFYIVFVVTLFFLTWTNYYLFFLFFDFIISVVASVARRFVYTQKAMCLLNKWI